MSSAINEQGNLAGGAWGRVSQADGPADQRHGMFSAWPSVIGVDCRLLWQRVRLDPQVVEDVCEEVRILLCPVGICSRFKARGDICVFFLYGLALLKIIQHDNFYVI